MVNAMASPIYDHHHAVQFYGDDDNLCSTVAAFLAQGFFDRHPAIVIATPAHTICVLDPGALTPTRQPLRSLGDL